MGDHQPPARIERAQDTGAEVAAAEELTGEGVELGQVLLHLGREQLGAGLPDGRRVAPEAQVGDRPRRADQGRRSGPACRDEPLERLAIAPRRGRQRHTGRQPLVAPTDARLDPGRRAQRLQPRAEEQRRRGRQLLRHVEALRVECTEPIEPGESPGQRIGGNPGSACLPGVVVGDRAGSLHAVAGSVDHRLQGFGLVREDERPLDLGIDHLAQLITLDAAVLGRLHGVGLALVRRVLPGQRDHGIDHAGAEIGIVGRHDQEGAGRRSRLALDGQRDPAGRQLPERDLGRGPEPLRHEVGHHPERPVRLPLEKPLEGWHRPQRPLDLRTKRGVDQERRPRHFEVDRRIGRDPARRRRVCASRRQRRRQPERQHHGGHPAPHSPAPHSRPFAHGRPLPVQRPDLTEPRAPSFSCLPCPPRAGFTPTSQKPPP